MELKIRRFMSVVDHVYEAAGAREEQPLTKVAIVAIVENPLAGNLGSDLDDMIKASVPLGEEMARRLRDILGDMNVQAYGKGGIVGLAGEQEHANAMLTTAFANPLRDAIGGGAAWISSFTKVAAPDATIDIPMNHKDDVYVRSHYNGMTVTIPGGPEADEVAVIFCVASRGRINARVGGLTHEEVAARVRNKS